ncbi:MAG: 16S rRNA (guanine(527)-N(7))-methyltransferase RsmG [Patescibacteria group bacterium]|nr:16S rRNA (guanine(527)-N(7))-methyltransferase RsmG [Patescibacteria group bacterium]
MVSSNPNSCMEDFFITVERLFDIVVNTQQKEKFALYENELLVWNARMNLTGIKTRQEIRIKHFLDSIACLLVLNRLEKRRKLIDIGTGAGFPGIVLKILIPDMHVTLIDATEKKLAFCRHITDMLGLSNVETIHERAEVLSKNKPYKEGFDVAVARAVAPLDRLIHYLLPFIHDNGVAIAMKGKNAHNEILKARIFSRTLIPYNLPQEDHPRYLVVLRKQEVLTKDFL